MAASWRLTACDVRKNPRSNTDPRMQRNYLGLTITFQRTVTTPLALCLSARVHSTLLSHFSYHRGRSGGTPKSKTSDRNVRSTQKSRSLDTQHDSRSNHAASLGMTVEWFRQMQR